MMRFRVNDVPIPQLLAETCHSLKWYDRWPNSQNRSNNKNFTVELAHHSPVISQRNIYLFFYKLPSIPPKGVTIKYKTTFKDDGEGSWRNNFNVLIRLLYSK